MKNKTATDILYNECPVRVMIFWKMKRERKKTNTKNITLKK